MLGAVCVSVVVMLGARFVIVILGSIFVLYCLLLLLLARLINRHDVVFGE